MSRFFTPITQEELKDKICKAWRKHRDCEWEDDEDPGREDSWYQVCYECLTEKIKSDLSKVRFDNENREIDSGFHPALGYHNLDGFVYLGILEGGDWEIPVYWICYFDGKELRGYIPEDGNTFNRTTKEAYGNDEKSDAEDIAEYYKGIVGFTTIGRLMRGEICVADIKEVKLDYDKLIADIKKRILPRS